MIISIFQLTNDICNLNEEENEKNDYPLFTDINPYKIETIFPEEIEENNNSSIDYLSFFNKKTILGIFPFQIQNKEKEEFGGYKLKETIKEKNSKITSTKEIGEIFKQNLNNNFKIKGACNIKKIKNILSENKIDKNIIDKIDRKFITNKDKESVSLFEIKV